MTKITQNKLLARVMALFISFVMVASSINITAYADDDAGIVTGVYVRMIAADADGNTPMIDASTYAAAEIDMGETGYFRLEVGGASISNRIFAVEVKLPEVLFDRDSEGNISECHLKDFSGFDGTNPATETVENTVITLLQKNDGNCYLQFEFNGGDTFSKDLRVSYPNGISGKLKEVEINASDITVTQYEESDETAGTTEGSTGEDESTGEVGEGEEGGTDEGTQSGRIEVAASDLKTVIKTGGKLKFVADFAWEEIELSATPTEVYVKTNADKKTGKLSSSITYTITGESLNTDSSGVIFTKEYYLNETVTLPADADICFPNAEEEFSVKQDEKDKGVWRIYSGGTAILEIETGNNTSETGAGTPEITIDPDSISIDESKKVLKYTIKASNVQDGETTAEVVNPYYTVKLTNLKTADAQTIKETYGEHTEEGYLIKIDHKTEFVATPLEGDSISSDKSVSTPVTNPAEAWSVSKSSNNPYIAEGAKITYTIKITNTSDVTLDAADYRFVDTLDEYLEYVPGTAKLTYYKENGTQDTISASEIDESFTGGVLNYTKNMKIPSGKTVTLIFTAKVLKYGKNTGKILGDNYKIKNKAQIYRGTKSKPTNETVDVYNAIAPSRTLTKTAKMVDGASVISGNYVQYTITLENKSSLELPFNVTDILPQYVDASEIKDVKITYTRAGKKTSSGTLEYQLDNGTDANIIIFNQIKLSALTSSKGDKAQITFKVKLNFDEEVPTGTPIVNTAQLAAATVDGRDLPFDSASATLLTVERKVKLSVGKASSNSPVRQSGKEQELSAEDKGGNSGLYSIGYTLKLTNLGSDFVKGVDKKEVIDVMSGGLMPDAVPGESGTITGTYYTGPGSSGTPIEGEYTRVEVSVKDASGNPTGKYTYNYKITWGIDELEKANSTDPYQTGRIEYTGWVWSSNVATVRNDALVDGSSAPTTVYAQVSPSIRKTIYSVNGVRTNKSTQRYSEVESGDVIVYEIKVSNAGNMDAVNAMITDKLPSTVQTDGGGYYTLGTQEDGSTPKVKILSAKWKSGEPLTGSLDSAQITTNSYFRWTGVNLYANDELTIRVQVQYPKGIAFINNFVDSGQSESKRKNIVYLAYNGSEYGGESNQNCVVNHTMLSTELDVTKTVDNNRVMQTGDTATFTISDFGTHAGVYGYKLVDELANVAIISDLTAIQTGAYEGISSYTLTLTYDEKVNGKNITKEISYSDASECAQNHTITGDELEHTTYPSAEVVTVTWEFENGGYVESMTIKEEPKLTVTATQGNEAGTGVNKVTLYWDESSDSDTAKIKAVNGIAIKKNAYVGSAEADNYKNPIRVGTDVRFCIEYKNITNDKVQLTGTNVITDRLTTKGLLEGEYNLTSTLINREGKVVENCGVLLANGKNVIEITENDIASSKAKEIKYTYVQTDGNTPYDIPADYTLRIDYTLTTSPEFEKSQLDKNTSGIPENWSYDNRYMLHNEASISVFNESVKAETGWYYQKGENKLKIQKSVRGFSKIALNQYIGTSAVILSFSDKSIKTGVTDLNIWEKKHSKNTTSSVGQPGEMLYNVYDVVSYTVSIVNDSCSDENLTIDTIKDVLPENVETGTLGNYGGKRFHKLLKQKILFNTKSETAGGGSYINTGYWFSFKPEGSGNSLDSDDSSGMAYGSDAGNLVSIESGYMPVDGYVSWDNGESESFKIYKSKEDKTSLSLKPGQYFTFTYFVVVNRVNADPNVWTNTATLQIKDTINKFSVGEDIELSAVPAILDVKKNDGDCTQVSDTSFSSTVNIYPVGRRVGLQKTTAAIMKKINSGQSFDETTTLDNYKTGADYAKIESSKSVGYGDLVAWRITIDNDGSAQSAKITDTLPYPYKAVTSTSGDTTYVMQRLNTSGEWENIAGTVTEKGSSFGESSQEVKVWITLPASQETTLRIWARYDGTAGYYSRNYKNTAKLELLGSTGSPLTINSVTAGTAVKSDGNIKAVTSSDYVHPSASEETSSVKKITNDSNETATGTDTTNYVMTSSAGDRVTYTLQVTNNSSGENPLSNMVLIDKLPQVGDTGSLDETSRKTEFPVNLDADALGFSAKIGETDVTAKATVEYKAVSPSAHFTASDWAGDDGNGWTKTLTEALSDAEGISNGTIAMRIRLLGEETNVPSGATVEISFNATVGASAAVNQIAWNSFGYAYTSALNNNARMYAEPAKVGVKIADTSISLAKIWNDFDTSKRPSMSDGIKVTVVGTITANNGKTQTVSTQTYKPVWTQDKTNSKKWTATISGLPIKDTDGNKISYTATEVTVSGYSSSSTVTSDGTFVFTNTQLKSISGTKYWNDNLTGHTAPSLTLERKVAGGKSEAVSATPTWTTTKLASPTGAIKETQSYTYTDLPAVNDTGQPYIYTVSESVPEGYTGKTGSAGNFTNTINTELEVVKVWKDSSDTSRRPDNLTVYLCVDSIHTQDEKKVTLSSENEWKASFENLPVYDETGQKINYSIDEDSVTGYTSTSSKSTSADGKKITVTLTNTLSENISIFGQKIWSDKNDAAGKRPENVTIKLYRDLNTPDKTDDDELVDTFILSSGSFSKNNLPKYNNNGVKYRYFVKENDVTYYTTSYHEETVTETGKADTYKFRVTNTYVEPDSTAIAFGFTKQLVDDSSNTVALGSRTFSFNVKYTNSNGEEVMETLSSDKNGGVSFSKEGFSKEGTYTFEITEADVSDQLITKDSGTLTVTVQVTRNGDNLVAGTPTFSKTTAHSDGSVTTETTSVFTNTLHTPTSVTYAPALKKTLTGGNLTDAAFSFTIESESRTATHTETVNSDASGNISFSSIEFTQTGNYWYSIKENKGTDGSIAYDSKTIRLHVNVGYKAGSDPIALEATAKYYLEGSSTELIGDSIGFTNIKYAPVTADLAITKKIAYANDSTTSRTAAADQFSFDLFDDNETRLATVKNGANGAVTFSGEGTNAITALQYTYADIGEHTYTISENTDNEPPEYYTYSTEEITAKVTVGTSNNQLTTTVEYYKGDVKLDASSCTITNICTKPTETTATIKAAKAYYDITDGDTAENRKPKAIANGDFTFKLSAAKGVPMPSTAKTVTDDSGQESQELTVAVNSSETGANTVGFPEITYSETGTYTYEISEIIGTNPSIAYDKNKITATVEVTLNEKDNALEAEVKYSASSGSTLSTTKDSDGKNIPEFTNKYTAPAGTWNMFAFKDLILKDGQSGAVPELEKGTYTFAITKDEAGKDPVTDADGNPITVKNGETGENDTADCVRFNNIPFMNLGDNVYYIREVVPQSTANDYDAAIGYDDTVFKVTAKAVYKTIDGVQTNELVEDRAYRVSRIKENGRWTRVDDYPIFTNTYTQPTAATASLAVKKAYYDITDGGEVAKEIAAGEFSFKLTAGNATGLDGTTSLGTSPLPTSTTASVGASTSETDKTATATFGNISYSKEGIYTYTIKETEGKNSSIRYDTTPITATVKVERNPQNNEFEITVTYTRATETVSYELGESEKLLTVTNTYTAPKKVSVIPQIKKKFVDSSGNTMELGDNEFVFKLYNADENGTVTGAAIDTKMLNKEIAAAQGANGISFVSQAYEEDPGSATQTYYYVIREEAGNNPSISYDATDILLKVEVSKNDENELVAKKTYTKSGAGEGQAYMITNTYTAPTKVSPTVQIKKSLVTATTGRSFGADSFTFGLYKTDENGTLAEGAAPVETVTTKGTDVSTETLSFSYSGLTRSEDIAPGTNVTEYYLIKEIAGSNPSISYSTDEVLVKIVYSKAVGSGSYSAEANKLEAKVTYKLLKDGEEFGEDVKTITNTYSVPTGTGVTPKVTKKLVDITDPGNTKDRAFGKDRFTFKLYEADEQGNKTSETPLDMVSTTLNSTLSEESLSFNSISYNNDLKVGETLTKYYLIEEAAGANVSIAYATTPILYTVTVAKDTTENKLVTTESYKLLTDGSTASETPLTVTNTYTAPKAAEAQLAVIKQYYDVTNNQDKYFGDEIFTFDLYECLDENGTLAEGATAIETVTTTTGKSSKEKLAFSKLSFSEDMQPGDSQTKYYLIKEQNPTEKNPSISCAFPAVIAKVVISKAEGSGSYSAEANKLEAEVTYKPLTGTSFFSENVCTVRNEYTEPQAVTLENPLQVKKAFYEVSGEGSTATKTAKAINAGEFSFTIEGVGEAPTAGLATEVKTASADSGTATLSFGTVEYTKAGEYHYLIKETKGTNPSITYDESVVEAVVTVVNTTGNKLAATTEYYVKENAEATAAEAGKTNDPTFENLYRAPEPTSVTLGVNKSLKDSDNVDRKFGSDIFEFELYAAGADGKPTGAALQSVSTTDQDKESVFKALQFAQLDLADDLAYGTDKTEYRYMIVEKQGTNPSISYDTEGISVLVTVTKDADNKLQAAVSYSRGTETAEAPLTVTNRYTAPTPAKYTLGFTKKYFDITSGTEVVKVFGSEVFSFTLYHSDENGTQGDVIETITTTNSTASSQDLKFTEFTYAEDIKAGDTLVKYYLIKENAGSDYSIDYDTKGILVKVTLGKNANTEGQANADNALWSKVEYQKETASGFAATWSEDKQIVKNTYTTPTAVTLTNPLQVKKAFYEVSGEVENQTRTAKAINGGEFSFTVEGVGEAPTAGLTTEVKTASADSGTATLSFGTVEYTKAGEYHYLIKETKGDNPSITYDDRVVEAVVTVVNTAGNALSASTEYYVKENAQATASEADKTSDPTLENLYRAPKSTSFVPQVTKMLVDGTNGELVPRAFGSDIFEFELYAADESGKKTGEVLDTVSTTNEDKELNTKLLSFKSIELSGDIAYGTDKTEYRYVIVEKQGTNPSIKYDTTPINVKVTITKTEANELLAAVSYSRGTETTETAETALTVTNIYTAPTPAQQPLEVSKSLAGRNLNEGEFSFELADEQGNVVRTAVNDADGNVSFDPLIFDEDADAKEYTYTLREVKGTLPSVIYDTSVYTIKLNVIKIKVDDFGKSELKVESMSILKGEQETEKLVFENRYSPYVPEVSVELKASKRFSGGTLSGGDFEFKLEPLDGASGSVRTVSNDKNGDISFGKYFFFTSGTYKYRISELAGSDKNISYDSQEIIATVNVTTDAFGRLQASVSYDKGGKESNTFVNKPVDQEDTVSVWLSAEKILQGRSLKANDFSFTLVPLNGAPGKKQTVTNNSHGDVNFGRITYTAVGSYSYEIVELFTSKMDDIVYDMDTVTATVRVYLDNDGELAAEVTYTKAGAESNTFLNRTAEFAGMPPNRPDQLKPENGSDSLAPKTGDDYKLALWAFLACGAAGGMFMIRRKEDEEQ